MKATLYLKLISTFSTFRFFVATLVFYVINTAWIALSGLYPMAFDEQFHLGLIRLYSTRLTPFWSSQPPGEAIFGAVARDPSYMYHYLLSFPFRILDNFVQSEAYQVIILRFVSLILVGMGIWIFRKVLLNAGYSKATAHVSLALLVITPLVPFFASQVNYDPLVFLCTAVTLLFAQKVIAGLRTKKTIDVRSLLLLAIVAMFGSLVKYAFLPVILAVLIMLVWQVRQVKLAPRALWQQSIKQFGRLSKGVRFGLAGAFILLFGLCLERYGMNIVRYHTPTPECNQVLSVDECMAYSPWRRNYLTTKSFQEGRLQTRYAPEDRQFVRYSITIWLSKVTDQLFFTIDGVASNFKIGKPYRAPRIASVILMVVGVGLFIWKFRVIAKRYRPGLFLLTIGLYCGALLAQNYLDYLHIGFPYAIQGRYLLPIMPLVYVLLTQAFSTALGKRRQLKAGLATLAILLFMTQAGGAGTYILRSNPAWWWPNQVVVWSNELAQKVLRPFVIGN